MDPRSFPRSVAGVVDADVPGAYNLTYECTDTSGNVVNSSSQVIVMLDEVSGELVIERFAMKSAVDGAYSTVGGRDQMVNVHPLTDLQLYWTSTVEMNRERCRYLRVLEGSGQTAILRREFESAGLSGQAIDGSRLTVDYNAIMVKKYDSIWPHCADLGECFVGVDLEDAKDNCLAQLACSGFSFSAHVINGGVGSGCYKACADDEDASGFGNSVHSLGPRGYWAKSVVPSGSLPFGLKDLTTYTVVLDEHFVRIAAGVGAGLGSLRQVVTFTTGDFTPPRLVASVPPDGTLGWPLHGDISLDFSESVLASINQSGTPPVLLVRRLVDGVSESVPCNGSASAASGAFLATQGQKVVVKNLGAWSGWRACRDYQVKGDAGCVVDTSVNANPSTSFGPIQFVTSCAIGIDPLGGMVDVPIDAPITVNFSDIVQVGTGDVTILPAGEPPFNISIQSFPRSRVCVRVCVCVLEGLISASAGRSEGLPFVAAAVVKRCGQLRRIVVFSVRRRTEQIRWWNPISPGAAPGGRPKDRTPGSDF